jgi:hypothetical protein
MISTKRVLSYHSEIIRSRTVKNRSSCQKAYFSAERPPFLCTHNLLEFGLRSLSDPLLNFLSSGGFAVKSHLSQYKQSTRIRPQKTFLFLSWFLFALLALLRGHLVESRRIKVNPRVQRKCEFSFSLNRSNIFYFSENFSKKSPDSFCLEKLLRK